ncbi:unnamed protein product [Staurois parvus]|uniref:Uncharacterized protein n=1 Tax=Staurois parvus TaxID=386267 RepID=A0ABN9HKX2_9NEOB|nr:unnamed protein product [Staurois parvus]
MLVILTVEPKGLNLCTVFYPVLSDPPLLPMSPSYLLIRHCVESLCTCSVWCVLLKRFFFFSWNSACDQHRANQHCPEVRSSVSS